MSPSKNQPFLDALADRLRAQQRGHSETPAPSPQTNGHRKLTLVGAGAPTDEQVLEKCRTFKNAQKFVDLYDFGDVHTHHGGDDSGADLGLMDILKFWTQDPAQLERLFSTSRLGQRNKWKRRYDYRQSTITKALEGNFETYSWDREERSRPMGKNSSTTARPLKGCDDDAAISEPDSGPKLELVRFHNRPKPKPREFIVPDLVPRYHPTTLYGWGGTAKSLLVLLLGMSVAARRKTYFKRDIAVHGPVLYIDFELDADEQHRRVEQLAVGMGMKEIPEDLMYVSALGIRTHDAIDFAYDACQEHDVVMLLLDSLGPAMVGDMSAAKDIIGFHNNYIAPFKGIAVTPILVDHQARQQAGEGYQSKGAFGSAYKEHLSRSLIQIERGDQDADDGKLNVRMRHKKTNFGPMVDPFDVALTFGIDKITASVRELLPSEKAQENTLSTKERILAALEGEPLFPDEVVEATGLNPGTVKNSITQLKKAGKIAITGQMNGRTEQVQLAASSSRPLKDRADDAANPKTVARLFANPPEWLRTGMKLYRENPDRHFRAMCTSVAAEVLGDGNRRPEIEDEVRKALEQPPLEQA